MKKILVVGAGRTATSLISYLIKQAEKQNWQITVADHSLESAEHKTSGHPKTRAICFDVFDVNQRGKEISKADIVV